MRPLERLHVFVVRFLVVALPAREEEPGAPGAFVNGHAAFASHDLDRQHLRRRLRLVEKSDDGLVVDAAVAAEVDEEDADVGVHVVVKVHRVHRVFRNPCCGFIVDLKVIFANLMEICQVNTKVRSEL